MLYYPGIARESVMDLSSINKRSTRSLVFTEIWFWLFAGYFVADGLDRLVHDRFAYRWVSSFLFCTVYVGMGVLNTVILLRRIPSDSGDSTLPSSGSISPAGQPGPH
jgi:hypothetical protein